MDMISTPVLLITGKMPISVPDAFSDMPNIFGMEGPVISASMTAVRRPLRCAVTANRAVVSDLPPPPLPLTTPITFLILLNSCGFLCISRSEQFSEQLPHSCVHSSDIVFSL